jgi:dipeptidase E
MRGKIFLSGGGGFKKTHDFDRIFLRNLKSVIYIPIAWKNNNFKGCLKWFKSMLRSHNKKVVVEMLTDLSKKIELNNFDAVYIGGGNTFKLLKKIKDSKFGEKLLKYYKNGGIIYGGSAGAIIWGNDITISKLCKDADVNKVMLKGTKGFNLLKNLDIQCHFEDNQINEHRKYINKTGRNVICIPEESAILIERGKYKVLGTKPVTLITKKEVKKYKAGKKI